MPHALKVILSRMRLVLATPLYPPDPGGPATYAALMERGLAAQGIEVALVKFGDVRGFPRLVRHAAYFFRLLRAMNGADALLVQDTVSCGVPAALAAFVTRRPLIVRVPGDYAWEQGRQRFGVSVSIDEFQTMRFGWQVESLRSLQRFVVGRARLVIVPSEYFAGVVRTWGVNPSRLTVILHGVSMPAHLPKPLRPPGLLMASLGRLVPWKGFRMLIELLPALPEWRLVIVGDGPERGALERRAAELSVADRVTFTGALARDAALGWCAAADAFVLNTSFESFSFQVAEAMLLGIPVIATEVGSIPELIESGAEGILLAPDDREGFRAAIESVPAEQETWSARIRAAKRKAAAFSEDAAVTRTAEALRSLI